MNYKQNKEKIIAAGIPETMIFDYEGDRLRKIYDQYFEWCDVNLKDYETLFNLGPCHFFYWDTLDANAGAASDGKNSFIRFSKGYMEMLNEKLWLGRKFFQESKFSAYHSLQKGMKDSLEYLMFQCSTIFSFYHEFAHVVQKQSQDFYLSERTFSKDFSFLRHVYEYDADLNGAQFVSMYIQQYFAEILPAELRTEANFKRLMYLGMSSIVITFLLFLNGEFDQMKSDKDTSFYTKERTHPHTFVRLYYVINHYVRNAKANNVKIDFQDTFNSVVVLCGEFFEETDIFKSFIKGMQNHFDEIRDYDFELYRGALEAKSCIRHKARLFKS